MASWEELIKSTSVKELVRSKDADLIYFKTGTTIRDALHTLSNNNILAAPVVDEKKDIVLGFVDVLDIAGFIVDQRSRLYGTRDRNFARKEFFDVVVERVLDYSMVDVPVTVPDSASVYELINLFNDQKMHRRLHRVAVSSHGKIYNIITQWDIIVFANKHKAILPHRSASIQEHGIIRSTIMSRIDAPFYETLETLYKNRFMGIALIDDNGHIDANFSASDLRGLTEKSFSLFTGSTLQFLVKGVEKAKAGAPVTCTADSSLESVLSTLVKEHVHRIYITGNNDFPYGIVSLGDIISALRV